ncbi:S-adenosyl methyltransferase [Haloactinospora alba]|uniref:S-adenosyl methyltransferase n=1 Tax=Haloactinospora alba TaxID=405555 RepID=A0A543NIM2_9ACTN|nr:SAM-dependent methyltransferase [Haloactinospora alba]TQN31600.1 S-adenosyl methyltransferase [Haloactinospora alba]
MTEHQTRNDFPPEIDMKTPSVARMYDYLLKGKDNFEIDRRAVEEMLKQIPEMFRFSHDNRAFLSRAVEYVSHEGIDQFLDLGAGLPTAENTHEVAQRVNPDARVIYVDKDPIVLAHGRAILEDNPNTSVITADITDTDAVLEESVSTSILDFDRPVCVMLVSMLHCIPDEQDPFGLVHRIFDRLTPGSALIYSHLVSNEAESRQWLTDKVHSLGTEWGRVRTPEEAGRVFQGLNVVDPGEVDCATWRAPERHPSRVPQDPGQRIWEHSGVAFKP